MPLPAPHQHHRAKQSTPQITYGPAPTSQCISPQNPSPHPTCCYLSHQHTLLHHQQIMHATCIHESTRSDRARLSNYSDTYCLYTGDARTVRDVSRTPMSLASLLAPKSTKRRRQSRLPFMTAWMTAVLPCHSTHTHAFIHLCRHVRM